MPGPFLIWLWPAYPTGWNTPVLIPFLEILKGLVFVSPVLNQGKSNPEANSRGKK